MRKVEDVWYDIIQIKQYMNTFYVRKINPIALRMAKTPFGVLAILSPIGLKQF